MPVDLFEDDENSYVTPPFDFKDIKLAFGDDLLKPLEMLPEANLGDFEEDIWKTMG